MRLLIIPFLFLVCTNAATQNNVNVIHFDSGFLLYQDTIVVDIKGRMTHALKYQDKFYLLFEQRVFKYGGYGKRWLYIIANGQIEKIVDCPQKMKTIYLDFFVKNDSIILKPYMDGQCYCFDIHNFSWKEIDKTDDLIFEDEKFYVYSLDFGEWGGKTWFKDKKKGFEYITEATTPLVNKIGTTYYFTNSYKVIKIENPLILHKCNTDITYKNIKKSGKCYSWYSEPIGFAVVYKDTTYYYFDYSYKPRIVSSFVWQKELLHIYETDTATYIAKIENNSIKTIQKIGEKLSFYRWHYSYRCRNLKGNNELLKFRTRDEQLFGLMDIVDNKIYVLYFVNNAEIEPKLVGTAKADSILVNRLNIILSDLGNLQLKDVDLKEREWGTLDITPNHKIGVGDSWNPKKYPIDTCKAYLIKEDSLISNDIIYYATKSNELVRTVIIDWARTSHKQNFLETFLTQKLGQPTPKRKETKNPWTTWETPSGLTVELSNSKTNYNNTRLVIYKN